MSASQSTPMTSRGHSYGNITASENANVYLGNQYVLSQDPADAVLAQLTKSLHFPEIFERYENIEKQHGSTYQWILHPIDRSDASSDRNWSCFYTWLHDEKRIYWISGKPGSGKSTLMKYLFEHVSELESFPSSRYLILSYWFWEAGEGLQNSWKGCLRSLILQILKHPSLAERKNELVTDMVLEPHVWTEDRLSKTFSLLLRQLEAFQYPILLFLDGLDENGGEKIKMLGHVEKLVAEFTSLNICVSSRPEQYFIDKLSSYPLLRLEDLNREDIEEIINEKFFDDSTIAKILATKQNLEQKLRNELIDRADGVILWVVLAIKSLIEGATNRDTPEMLQASLKDLPPDLEDLFRKIIARSSSGQRRYREETALYFKLFLSHTMPFFFQWCMAINPAKRSELLQRPFRWAEIDPIDALNCDDVEIRVSVRTGGLLHFSKITYRPYQDARYSTVRDQPADFIKTSMDIRRYCTIQLYHRTVQTFLLNTERGREILAACEYTQKEIEQIALESSLVGELLISSLLDLSPSKWRISLDLFMGRSPAEKTLEDIGEVYAELSAMGCNTDDPIVLYGRVLRKPFTARRAKKGFSIDLLHLCISMFWNKLALKQLDKIGNDIGSSISSRLMWTMIRSYDRVEWKGEETTATEEVFDRLQSMGASAAEILRHYSGDVRTCGEEAMLALRDFNFMDCLDSRLRQLVSAETCRMVSRVDWFEDGFRDHLKSDFLRPDLRTELPTTYDLLGDFCYCDVFHITKGDLKARTHCKHNQASKVHVVSRCVAEKVHIYPVSTSDSEKIFLRLRRLVKEPQSQYGSWPLVRLTDSGTLQIRPSEGKDGHANFATWLDCLLDTIEPVCGFDAMLCLGKCSNLIRRACIAGTDNIHPSRRDALQKLQEWLYGPSCTAPSIMQGDCTACAATFGGASKRCRYLRDADKELEDEFLQFEEEIGRCGSSLNSSLVSTSEPSCLDLDTSVTERENETGAVDRILTHRG